MPPVRLLTMTAAPVAATTAPTPRAIEPHPHLDEDGAGEAPLASASFFSEDVEDPLRLCSPEFAVDGGDNALQAAPAAGRYADMSEYAPVAFCAIPLTRS